MNQSKMKIVTFSLRFEKIRTDRDAGYCWNVKICGLTYAERLEFKRQTECPWKVREFVGLLGSYGILAIALDGPYNSSHCFSETRRQGFKDWFVPYMDAMKYLNILFSMGYRESEGGYSNLLLHEVWRLERCDIQPPVSNINLWMK